MMKKKVTTMELLHLNEAAKALKQKEFQICNNIIIGTDNINNYVCYVRLSDEFMYDDISGFIINQRELSAFVKSITIETEFELTYDMLDNKYYIYSNSSSKLSFSHNTEFRSVRLIEQQIIKANSIDRSVPYYSETDVTSELSNLFSLKKDDGCFYYNFRGIYFITLFNGLLPLNKSDKVYITIFPNNRESFIARFRVKKKKFTINIYLAYLYVSE